MERKRKKTPYLYISLSFIGVILIGTLLFWLPWSTVEGAENMSLIDAYFMSSSAVCVTGLTVIPNVGLTLSIYGKVVLALLIEVGGISILTIGVFLLILIGKKVGMSSRFLMKEALNQNSVRGIVKFVKKIVIMSFSFQIIGLIVNMFVFLPEYHNFWEALGISAFHSLSSFNNAGFDIFGGTNSMVPYASNILLNINTMFLIVIGGLGFIVIFDIFKKNNRKKLSLHSKIVLLMTVILIVVGSLGIKLSMGNSITWLQAIFTSVTTRTAGFNTFDMSNLSTPAYMQVLILMFIGASPCSTGGGIKTTTMFLVIITIISITRGKQINVFKRRIAAESAYRAFSLIIISLVWICFACLVVSWVDPEFTFQQTLFETVSAFGTVGLSQGVASSGTLSIASKIILALTMLFGRLGPLTVLSMWNKNWLKNSNENIRYLEEKLIIG